VLHRRLKVMEAQLASGAALLLEHDTDVDDADTFDDATAAAAREQPSLEPALGQFHLPRGEVREVLTVELDAGTLDAMMQ